MHGLTTAACVWVTACVGAACAIAQWQIVVIGVPDYETYVAHRRANHPDRPIMTYVEFFRERQQARYAVGKGRFRGCC